MKPRPELPGGPYLVAGLARSGVAAARVLLERGERVIGLDAGTPRAARALEREGAELHLQDADGTELVGRVGAVVKSPGVPGQARAIAAARAQGVPVLGELELAWRLLPNEFVAVTGTNGKTTTVELIGHVHREAGRPAAVAGNVGTAVSALAGTIAPEVTVICEASSFQLEDTLAFAPEAAVLLNLSPDHLDRHGTLAAYARAKLEAFARQGAADVAVLPADVSERLSWAGARADLYELDGELWWKGSPLIALGEMRLRGRHNAENAMAAAAVCLARGIEPQAVRAGLASFHGVAHRLEEVEELAGVLYVNDSKATNVASTLVALESFAGRPLHLILGGQGKGQDFSVLREPVARACAGVYLIGEDASTIAAALANIPPPVLECGELARALRAARAAATCEPPDAAGRAPGSPVVLLSPACASFDQFADFEARGERFRELVEKLQG